MSDYLLNKLFIMKSKIAQTIIAGLIVTAVMTIVRLMAPYVGLPKMNTAEMFSAMMGVSLPVSFLIHLMIGIIFAAAYVYLFNPKVHIQSKLAGGLLYRLAVFVFAQVMMIGSLIGHLVYGTAVALIVPDYSVERTSKKIKTAHTY